MEMSRTVLRDLCMQHKLYRTPHLNDKLYLNFKGFTHIANLEEYTNLKALFLEGNALQSLQGMPRLEQLKCLYVHQNCMRSLSGLEQLPNLDTLNISSNGLNSLEHLQSCPALATLIAEHNHLSTLQALAPLLHCTNLHTLDLQNNHIEDPAVLDAVAQLPELRCLYLKGNPMVSKVQNYRKTVISRCPNLTYLDDRPVTEEERLCCNAWATGGLEAERAERMRLKEEAASRDRRNFEWMQQLRREGFRKRRAMLGLPDGDTDPFMDTLTDQEQQHSQASAAESSDDEVEDDFVQEPPELLAARQQLAAYTARPGEEEPPELSRARQELVRQGKAIQEGSWEGPGSTAADGITATAAADGTAAPGSIEDGAVYFASVRASQQELDAAGTGAGVASAATVASSLSTARPAGPDFSKLRAATEAALAAVGMADMAGNITAASTAQPQAEGLPVEHVEDTEAITQQQDTIQQLAAGTGAAASAAADQQQQQLEPEPLCMMGSWSSRSGSSIALDDAAASTAGSEPSAEAGGEGDGQPGGGERCEGSSCAVVAPEDVLLVAEPSAAPAAAAATFVADDGGNSLYELD